MEKHPVVAFVILDKNNHVVTEHSISDLINVETIKSAYLKAEYVDYSTDTYDEEVADLKADYIHHMYVLHLNMESESEKELPNTLRLDFPYLKEQWYCKEFEKNDTYRIAKYTLYLYHK